MREREAAEIVGWDHTLIWVKLHRALDGHDRFRTGEDDEDDPVQNDWNGTAKLTLILLERSEAAWCTREFVRPGFDEQELV